MSELLVEEYEQHRIGFNEIVKVNKKTGQVQLLRFTPYEGWRKRPLEGEAFYLKVDRQDLASAYQRRMNIKNATGIVGGAAILRGC